MKKPKVIYIIEHDENGRSGHGPFKSAEFYCLNTSYPKTKNDTVTYRVEKLCGEIAYITVSMVHNIQGEA